MTQPLDGWVGNRLLTFAQTFQEEADAPAPAKVEFLSETGTEFTFGPGGGSVDLVSKADSTLGYTGNALQRDFFWRPESAHGFAFGVKTLTVAPSCGVPEEPSCNGDVVLMSNKYLL